MRRFLLSASIISLVALAGCKGAEAPSSSEPAAEAMAESADSRGAPNIAIKAAPGVAFTYRYDFVLPDTAIAGVQEGHAAACEKLGANQCRITGMRYTLHEEERITAQLNFKLAPQLARNFGKEGIVAIEKAAGKLVDAEITGDDVAPTIEAARQQGDDATARLAKIEAQSRAGGLGDEARSELEAQAGSLRDQIANATASRTGAQAQLASTPMTFSYTGDTGFSLGGNPVGEALRSAWSSLSTMVWFVLMAVGMLLPWAILFGLLIAGWRSRPGLAVRRFLRGKPKPEAAA